MRAMTEEERKTYEKMKALREQCGSEDGFIKTVALAICFLHEEIKKLQGAILREEMNKMQRKLEDLFKA